MFIWSQFCTGFCSIFSWIRHLNDWGLWRGPLVSGVKTFYKVAYPQTLCILFSGYDQRVSGLKNILVFMSKLFWLCIPNFRLHKVDKGTGKSKSAQIRDFRTRNYTRCNYRFITDGSYSFDRTKVKKDYASVRLKLQRRGSDRRYKGVSNKIEMVVLLVMHNGLRLTREVFHF